MYNMVKTQMGFEMASEVGTEILLLYCTQIVLKMQEDKVSCRDETVQLGKLANKTKSVSVFIECEARRGEVFSVSSELSPCKSI